MVSPATPFAAGRDRQRTAVLSRTAALTVNRQLGSAAKERAAGLMVTGHGVEPRPPASRDGRAGTGDDPTHTIHPPLPRGEALSGPKRGTSCPGEHFCPLPGGRPIDLRLRTPEAHLTVPVRDAQTSRLLISLGDLATRTERCSGDGMIRRLCFVPPAFCAVSRASKGAGHGLV